MSQVFHCWIFLTIVSSADVDDSRCALPCHWRPGQERVHCWWWWCGHCWLPLAGKSDWLLYVWKFKLEIWVTKWSALWNNGQCNTNNAFHFVTQISTTMSTCIFLQGVEWGKSLNNLFQLAPPCFPSLHIHMYVECQLHWPEKLINLVNDNSRGILYEKKLN